jgi:uncharacterized lipoprotein NlpE involved in copper resistance
MTRETIFILMAAVACLVGCNNGSHEPAQAKPVSFYVGDSAAREAVDARCVDDVELMTTDGDCLNAFAAQEQIEAANVDAARYAEQSTQFARNVAARAAAVKLYKK